MAESEFTKRVAPNAVDRTGIRYGRWIVLRRAGIKQGRTRRERWATWFCRCDCGIERIVDGGKLAQGASTSCGCSRKGRTRPGTNWKQLPNGEAARRRLLKDYMRGARLRGLVWSLTPERFYELTKMHCHYCGSPPRAEARTESRTGSYLYNGVDRFDNMIGYIEVNCVPCCTMCNRSKLMTHGSLFLEWIDQLVRWRLDHP